MMQTRELTVTFVSPAFLGDAKQNGAWRTPPFKALLRQWWRVAVAQDFNYDWEKIRGAEGRLFGHAWLSDDKDERGRKVAARRSLVRLRLDGWGGRNENGVAPMRVNLGTSYSWFGIMDARTQQPLRSRLADNESTRVLKLMYPDEQSDSMDDTLRLIQTFGQVGYRARIGWGSVHLDGIAALHGNELAPFCRPLDELLRDEWPQAIGKDRDGALVWESRESFSEWAKALEKIAGLRKDVRVALKDGRDLRPLLGFTQGKKRAASPLRWRLFRDDAGRLRVRVFALPHRLPSDAGQRFDPCDTTHAWSTIIRTLDDSWLQRIAG